jgi:hypothetical protein
MRANPANVRAARQRHGMREFCPDLAKPCMDARAAA